MASPPRLSRVARSHTFSLSNHVVLSELDLKRHLKAIQEFDLPLDILPVFLHEAAHHWCFNSPVGLAVFFLSCRARRAALQHLRRSQTDYSFGEWDVYDHVVRYEFVQDLMRPLAEGLALFAEHDAVPGDALTISTPMQLAGTLFARGLAVRRGTGWQKLPLVLAGGRLTSRHIRRKTNLLMQPLDFRDGGYLAGYLCIKNLWMMNLKHLSCTKFLDTDFYLQFARSFFYEDWALVARLLDGNRSDVGALGPIVDRLQRRMIAFGVQSGRQDLAIDFERRSDQREFDTLELRAGLGQMDLVYIGLDEDNEEANIGRQRLQAAFKDLFDEWPDDEESKMLSWIDTQTLALRGAISLGHAEFEARTDGGDLVFFDEERPIFSIRHPDQLSTGWSGRLSVDAIVTSEPPGIFFFFTRDAEVIKCISVLSNEVPEILKEYFGTGSFRIVAQESLAELLREALQEDEGVEVARQHAERQLRRLVEAVYVPRALAGPSEETFASVRDATRRDGLLALLDGDIGSLADLAAASLCAPLEHSLASVSSFHRWSREDPVAAVSEINDLLERQLGFRPMLLRNGIVWAAFV